MNIFGGASHRRFRAMCLLFLLTTVAGVGMSPAAGAAPSAESKKVAAAKYVAMGDSYSSGLGAGDYGDSGDCKRSSHAYPQLWANQHAPEQFDFVACSGARTTDVLANQLSALDKETSLVTISIGGNDFGFSDVMTTCTTGNDDECLARVAEATTYIKNKLPIELDSVYAKLAEKAPNAEIVVLGYPRIYQLNGSCDAGLSEVKRGAIDSAADILAGVTANHVAEAGLSFVDLREPFAGHEICSPDWWLHSITWPIDESYHPNQQGQASGYLPAMESAVS